jgi:hypothetical protein
MKKLSILLISAFASLFFYQCQPDEIILTPKKDQEIIVISENISSDVTWTSGNTYVLESMIAVTDNATLTIEPCVVVKADNGTTGLIVSQGAKIDAQGTATCPIIFTSIEDSIEPGTVLSPNLTEEDHGLWSGIFILGNAPASTGLPSNIISLLPEYGEFAYGGDNPEDNSGTLAYVSIRHTGYETAPFETPSGLNLGGVGTGTTIDKVEVFACTDDGFLIYGGTVNVTNVVASGFRDDGLDCDVGFAGIVDNLIGIGGNDNNYALELSGGDGPENPSFTIQNASFKGSQVGEGYIDFRANVNCTVENAYFFGFDANAQVSLDKDEDASNWLAELVDVSNVEFNTSHLSSGNTTIETIFVDAGDNGNDAFTIRLPDASIVTSPTVGADKSVFLDWTVAGQTGALDDF